MFASKINEMKASERSPQTTSHENRSQVSPGEINAMGLFHEVLHYVIDSYVNAVKPTAFKQLEESLKKELGESDLSKCSEKFVELFPPTSVYQGKESAKDFLASDAAGIPRRHVTLNELILLWIENRNPAFDSINDLIGDSRLKTESHYDELISLSDTFFETQPKYGPTNSSLLKMLLAPIEAHPNSISDQLQFMVKHWEKILAKSPYLLRLLNSIDFIKEEGRYFQMLAQAQADKSKIPDVLQAEYFGFGDKEPPLVPQFKGRYFEPEQFSTDLGWMPRLVLIAKNVYVWLDQLSKEYQRAVTRLDQIPDEELEILAKRGFSGLWLIGIWSRSPASQKIKHLNGNVDAIASAYSLSSYDVSPDLGGEDALRNLGWRASRYGIRLASDMVPNHMGIDSSWVINHPDWFLKSDYLPFPNYSFNGPDLSNDERVGVFIEDGYWTKRDAAVVFKRLDRWTGDVRYIYHGNDGTHMPWNDTAQLDFTKPEVREAVIQTIVHVARMFPIIRFDAAMVLSKKHYQRLWFPEPGTGGAIPSRSNFSMTKEQFDKVVPNEFWREVVDRVQEQAPDTLLLAEAFWLMEGYFVRTLGMHRVYNSAFMNMLRREDNANYRQVIKNVLEYNPQILKRYVNFVNNPDEETAIAQFGKDDKYFGVCVMMATMPGLPMFGHGQIEGFTEKYGMEYRRAYRDEFPDRNLVARHEREIFPLLIKRHLFSEVDNFLLYDLFTGNGAVNEDVFAYSNGVGSERALVVYNNRYSQASGWIRTSVGFLDSANKMVQRTLGDGLLLNGGKGSYCVFEDVMTGIQFIRSTASLGREGLYIELGAYKYNVFMNFHEVYSTGEMPYGELCKLLEGRGVPSIEEELLNYKLRNVHAAFYEAINAGSLRYLVEGLENGRVKTDRSNAFKEKLERLISTVAEIRHFQFDSKKFVGVKRREYKALLSLINLTGASNIHKYIARYLSPSDDLSLSGRRILITWLFLDCLKEALSKNGDKSCDLIDDLRLSAKIRDCFSELNVDAGTASYETRLIRELLEVDDEIRNKSIEWMLLHLLKKKSAQELIGVNFFQGSQWFNKERFEDLLGYLTLTCCMNLNSIDIEISRREIDKNMKNLVTSALSIVKAAKTSEYRLGELLTFLENG